MFISRADPCVSFGFFSAPAAELHRGRGIIEETSAAVACFLGGRGQASDDIKQDVETDTQTRQSDRVPSRRQHAKNAETDAQAGQFGQALKS